MLAVLGMLVYAVVYAAGGMASAVLAPAWWVGGLLGLASTGVAMVGVWLYSGRWR